MTTYGGGLRVAELVHLRPQDIHSERMLMRMNQGKGHKDRYTLLSPRLLEELRSLWREYRPKEWLFPNGNGSGPLPEGTAQKLSTEKQDTHSAWARHSFAAAFFCDALDGSRCGNYQPSSG